MAVEIPVVIDIEAAFAEAAKKVDKASAPLRSSIDDLNKRISDNIQLMNMSEYNDPLFKQAAKDIQVASQAMEVLNDQFIKYSTNEGSIKQMNAELASLSRRWEEMGRGQKFTADGKLSADAKKLRSEYVRVAAEVERTGWTLSKMAAEEQKLLSIKRKVQQTRKYENAILNSTVKTMKVLQEQERILSDRLNRTAVGGGKYGELKRQLESVRAEIEKINGKPFDKMSEGANRAGRSLSSLLVNAAKLYALHSAGRFVRNIREVTSEFELQKVALGSIIKDTQRAEDLFRQIKAAAIQSPFEIKDLVSYTKQLSAYQIETDKLFDTTKKLADVSAGLGVDMSRLVLAYGQVRAAAVLRGQELRQFTEAGIPLVDKLAEKFTQLRGETVKTGEVFQLISERAVPFRMIEEIFDDMTNAGGMFYKMQEKQAKTLAGQWANLKDAASIMYDEIGNTEPVHKAMETLIADVRWLANNWRIWGGVVKTVGSALIAYIGYTKAAALVTATLAKIEAAATAAESAREKGMKRLITSIIGKTAAEKISTKATHLASYATYKAAFATNTLSKALWQLTMALLSNPFGAIVAAAGALVAVFTTLHKKTRDVGADLDAAKASIDSYNKTRGETQNLIETYEELRKKEKLTADESKKLRDVTDELAKAFPRASEGIDKNTNSLKLNIDKLKEYNEEAKKATRKALEAQIRIDEKEVASNEKEIDRLTSRINRGVGKFNPVVGVIGYLFQTDKQIVELDDKINKLRDTNDRYTASINEMKNALAGVESGSKESSDALMEWQNKLIKFNERTIEHNKQTYQVSVLSPDEIKNYSKLEDALEDVAKKYKKQAQSVKILEASIKDKNGEEEKELKLALALAIARRDLTKEMLDYYHSFFLTEKKSGGSGGGYQKDPFITRMENWMKFMKDFRKGYDDLRKYMSDTGALERQFKIMETRGLSMGINATEQKRAATDLSKWYEDTAKKAFAEAKKHGAKGSMAEFMSQQISDKTNKGKTLRAFQELLQSLWNEKTDFDTSQAEKNIEKAIKDITDKIKKTETARNFYRNILDLTGDEQLAADMSVNVYGGIGKDFKERIQEQLYRALTEVQPKAIGSELMAEMLGDITVLDVDNIRRNLESLPPKVKELFEKILEENQKYNADWLVDFEKTYQKAATYEERISRLEKQRAQKEKEAAEMGKSPEEVARITAYYNKQIAEVQLEALKDTYTWTKAFEDLDGVSSITLNNLIDLIDEYVRLYGSQLEPNQLKELTRAKEKAKAQLLERNSYAMLFKSVAKIAKGRGALNKMEKDGLKNTKQYVKLADDLQDRLTDLEKAINDIISRMDEYMSSAKDLMNVFASDDSAAYFGTQMDNISKALSGIGKTTMGVAQLASGMITPQAIMQTLTGISDIVTGIFSARNAARIRDIDKKIAEQQRLIDDLEYSYGRLEKAMESAFGSDYISNYTKQLDELNAKQKAYQDQADLESGKGKKADPDKIKEYQQAAKETGDEIADLRGQLAKYFSGTDLTSAAKEFSDAWIDAYKEFGNTTDAMKEKFQDMVQNMIQSSVGAKIMQTILQPLFDQIDAMAESGGELSVQEIAQIGQMAPEYIDKINNAMTNLMAQLTAAGYNVRQQSSGLTGISRDLAGASEESINGLAAGINTQNFYMSLISQNVAAIYAAMTGVPAEGSAGTPEVVDPYKEQMLMYVSTLPQMRDDMYAIRSMLEKVVKPNGTSATHYVSVRM